MLDLQYVSPELLKARNLDLAVPGRSIPRTVRATTDNRSYRYIPKWKTCHNNIVILIQTVRHSVEAEAATSISHRYRREELSVPSQGYVSSTQLSLLLLIEFISTRSRRSPARRTSHAAVQPCQQFALRRYRLFQARFIYPAVPSYSSRSSSRSSWMGER